jgi:hypothetical protein
MLDAYQYATYVNEFDAAQGNALTYPETALAKILDGSDQINYPNTNTEQKYKMKNVHFLR